MSYVVKVTAYLDQSGFPVSTIKQAHLFESKEIAEATAIVSDGVIKEVTRVIQPPKKVVKALPKEKIVQKKKETRSNQSWMKKGVSNG